jgi:TonB family protein
MVSLNALGTERACVAEVANMKSALASLLLVFVVSSLGLSQDVKVREEAVRLLEKASVVSSPAKLPNLERVDTFRAFADAGVKEGSFSRTVIQGVGRREEYVLGDYHLLNVWTQKQVAVTGTPHVMPGEFVNLWRLTPIRLVRFDGEDVIHSIAERDVAGRKARCIEFDTIKGQQTENNEICVDASTSVFLELKLGAQLIENSDFFEFAGALMPGKIQYSVGGMRKMEISQSMKALADGEANVLSAPPGAEIQKRCTTFRRPFGISMPQPKAGNGGTDVDVIVHATVLPNGRVYEATIQNSERPDLNDEALASVKQWTFTPAMCDGNPKQLEVSVSVHFQGR